MTGPNYYQAGVTYVLCDDLHYRPKYDTPFIVLCDIVNKETGKTHRDENYEIKHQLPIGALVEIVDDGVRLFVASHDRDCDGTPLYSLTPYDAEQDAALIKIGIKRHVAGMPEDSLLLIKEAP